MSGMTYDEAMEAARNGGKVKRDEWPEGEFVYYLDGVYVIQYAAGGDNTYITSDLDEEAEDWNTV
ncbi:Thoeris anti-defense Tad2 family protein [Klebsiella michiganensis]|uniref:Thoeris anti-defense Tad2 family protein n=1 Tax=Klebsiella michiganensis TaxID=1134687 RepID=UPI00311D4E9E